MALGRAHTSAIGPSSPRKLLLNKLRVNHTRCCGYDSALTLLGVLGRMLIVTLT